MTVPIGMKKRESKTCAEKMKKRAARMEVENAFVCIMRISGKNTVAKYAALLYNQEI